MAQMKFSKESSAHLSLSDLLLNIWSYAEDLKNPILNQYATWHVELADVLWNVGEFLDFKFVITNLLNRNKKFHFFGKIASCDKKLIYEMVKRWLFLDF